MKILDTCIFYVYCLLIFSIPLTVATNLGNPFYSSKNSILVILSAILILLIFINYIAGKKNKFILILDKDLDPYVGFFFFAFILSAVFSINPYFSYNGHYARLFALEQVVYIFILYFFSSAFILDNKRRDSVILLIEICGFFVSAYTIAQVLGWDFLKLQPGDLKRPVSTIGNSVFVGGFLLLCFPFSLANSIERKKINFSLFCSILILVAIILSQTRIAYIGIILEIFAIIFLYSFIKKDDGLNRRKILKRFKNLFIVFASILILLIPLVLFAKDNIYVKRFISINEIFENSRWILWRDSFKIFLMYPVTGSGAFTFPLVFENVCSQQFRILDNYSNYDNAHNNFINTLCTMGIIGAFAYLLLIIRSAKLIVSSLFSKVLDYAKKIRYIPFFAMMIGYIIFSMTEFDDLSIMLYLFVCFSLLKSLYSEDHNLKQYYFPGKLTIYNKLVVTFLILILISFVSYNAYKTIYKLEADRYFAAANLYLLNNDCKSSFENYKSAIQLWNDNSYYRYQHGLVLLNYATTFLNAFPDIKKENLENARNEFEFAKQNYASERDCSGYISILDYELGDTVEAEKIKDMLLAKDSLFLSYRSELAVLYIKKENFPMAVEQLLIICKYDPNNKVLNNNISDILNKKNFPDSKGFCKKILNIDPHNVVAKKYIQSH